MLRQAGEWLSASAEAVAWARDAGMRALRVSGSQLAEKGGLACGIQHGGRRMLPLWDPMDFLVRGCARLRCALTAAAAPPARKPAP